MLGLLPQSIGISRKPFTTLDGGVKLPYDFPHRSKGFSGNMKLCDIADVRMGYPFRSRVKHDPQGNVAILQMKDIDTPTLLRVDEAIRVTLSDVKDQHLIRQGDLVFRSRGSSNLVALIGAPIDGVVLAAPMLRIRTHAVTPAYLQWFINLQGTQALLRARAEGTSVQMISKSELEDLDVPVPSSTHQRLIVEAADLMQKEQSLASEIATRRKNMLEGVLLRSAQDTR